MTKYLIGIDVGGTNTDSVLLDPSRSVNEHSVVAWNKQLTTNNVSLGIETSLEQLFKNQPTVQREDILSVTIGTTHFINAIVERDRARLDKVAVLRLCGPYSSNALPFCDFPKDLSHLLHGYSALLKGGCHVDGGVVSDIDEDEVVEHVLKIKELGIKAIAITGVFSPIFNEQELKVAEIISKVIPDTAIVTSSELSGIGLLERENLTILNASVKRFANKIIKLFAKAIKNSGLHAPVLLTQNDGTVLTINEALKIPIKTFSSGTTNSMRGASFLLNKFQGQSVIVVDVGGTTTDVGLLLPNGYPRKTSSFSYIGGVKTRLSMPQVESIGLGGGSLVRDLGDHVSIGPDSVGNDFSRSLVGGGDQVTTSDISVAKELDNPEVENPIYAVGDKEKVRGKFNEDFNEKYNKQLNIVIENVIDKMKTSPEDIPVLLVGGGSFILPDRIKGASEVWRPKFFQVANAIGAAIGKISSIAQAFGKIEEKEVIVEKLKKEASERAIDNGALESSITVVDITIDEVPYANINKFEVKVIADVDYAKLKEVSIVSGDDQEEIIVGEEIHKDALGHVSDDEIVDLETYRPTINDGNEWLISKTDLDFLRIGNYILGCGGGGDPYPQYLIARTLLEKGKVMRVIDADSKKGYSSLSVAFVGSPTVANERLQGSELAEAYNLLKEEFKDIETVLALEIGGGNGFQGLLVGAELGTATLDADLMGRAYPFVWQITPVVLSNEVFYSPFSFSDGNGNDVLVKRTKSNQYAEKIIRAALSELGSSVGMVSLIKDANALIIKNSLSLSWRIGRAVSIAKQKSDIMSLPDYIIESIKPTSSKKLFEGKIIGVEKKLHKGYNIGEVIIDNGKDTLRIPFQNENLIASINGEVVASVPDLITVIDADSGEAVGTPDYRYGLVVFVLVISPCNHWTDTEKGMQVGGPGAFGFDDVEYKPVGKYVKPRSVIEEFS